MDLVGELSERFAGSMSPEIVRSRRLWSVALGLVRSPLNRAAMRSDKIGTTFALENTRDAYLGRRPVIWANLLFPSELINGTGNLAFYPELAAAVMASARLSVRFLEAADEAGFSPDLCSFHRATLGAALGDFLPRPDLLLSTAYPCDSAPLAFSFLADHYGVEHINVDLPTPDGRGTGLDGVAEQMRHIAEVMAGLSGDGADLDQGMREAVILSNRARRFALEIESLRRERTTVLDGWDAMGHLAVLAMMPGTRACGDFFEALKDDMRRQSEAPANENARYRLLWMHLKPYFPNDLGAFLRERGVRIVCEEYNRCYWPEMDPDRPFESLATKATSHFIAGPAERRASEIVRLAREYRVDGAVHFSHRGCRQSCGCAQQVKDELDRAGILTLILEGECIDPREYREGQVRTRIEAFLETLDG